MLESTLLPLTNYKLSEVNFPRISFLKQSDCIAPASIFHIPSSCICSHVIGIKHYERLGASDLSCLKSSLMFSGTKSSKTVKILFVLRRSCRKSNFFWKKMARKIHRWAFSIFDRFNLAAEPYISNP